MGLAVGANRVIVVSNPCPVCRSWEAGPVASRDRYGKPLTTVACRGCGLLRTDPMPSESDLDAFYAADYRRIYKGVRRPKPKHIYRSAVLATARIARLRSVLPPPQRVLDAGSGSGEFCFLAQAEGYQVTGIEADPEFTEHARTEYGMDVVTAAVASAEFGAGSFDAVTMFHVLEHLPDPVKVLQAIGEWTKPGGVLVVEVPNTISPNQHPGKRFHYAHVLGFSSSSLRFCLHAGGWRVTELTLDAEERNLFAFAVKSAEPAHEEAVAETGLREELRTNYYLRLETYRRWWRRMLQFAGEYVAAGKGRTAREIVERARQSYSENPA
jgi:SAM-dependent methyltransferase